MTKFWLPKSQRLAAQSAGHLDVFTKTKDNLQKTNEEINNHQSELKTKIATLSRKHSELDTVKAQNARIVDRIDSFFN